MPRKRRNRHLPKDQPPPLNRYRIMWVMVYYDLPVMTKADRRQYALFRDRLMKNGFLMFQFSVYARPCASTEIALVHRKRVRGLLPPKGVVGISLMTDKQFGDMEIYHGRARTQAPEGAGQLQMF